ncbi:MAG: hypothetical protein A2487_17545 [Candidatus Raymondbacteria bacterium RifOxyC12_full_50_8]|uniref:Uncharacterized protein n=1 Tax=Candidatus Raymondbacteria bacterium RIFOXYD12_FULL_49_13 TaxID=1817890 RepID=A0A1F7FCD3_UNCRA|nr:MAG: hypothetical protein A2248_02970 [Candidatus Raymondbacteria bacterium RIFOXYA2_FULL_49_16]OGJ94213.1 MAG: hypothetical protein A2487_17545 [Candidatus Raymondbacteria bacterium RifOxyC12_full_50_8]OGK03155.1 MAG: hypothetical protein A2350_15065 [Candidatus Raymondbacteria bacterium RifOxyB12_full_50_8]OGK04298.1 MAG: hypothetical protein A2519_18240 [Candidatus Raymondbacteria bacterium RIFOXYD12_FULL_49_13]OGP42419.1 MAG: hypothetical protein A2324_17005 [Candidatus Raymondbacteria b
MFRIIIFLAACCLHGQSILKGVEFSDWGPDETYFLKFDKTPNVYYPITKNSACRVHFMNTSVSKECLESVRSLKRAILLSADSGCMASVSVAIPLVDNDWHWETLPFPGTFVITVRPDDLEKIWEKSFTRQQTAPAAMRLFERNKTEYFFWSFDTAIASVLVHTRPGVVSVELYGNSAPPNASEEKIKSRFIKTLSWATASADSLRGTAVSWFDITTRKDPLVVWDFSGNTLKITFKKG